MTDEVGYCFVALDNGVVESVLSPATLELFSSGSGMFLVWCNSGKIDRGD